MTDERTDLTDADRGAGTTAEPTGSWRELFSAQHLAASLVLAGGVALYAMNAFITAAILPTTVADIGGEQFYAWVTTSFLVASVFSSMLVARVLAAWGASRSYLVAFVIFALGSVVATLTPTMEILLGARILQGLGGGLLAGLGYAVIRDALPEHLWTRAAGLVSAMWGFGTLIGPALGGLFAQFGVWRGAFALLAVAAVILGVLSLRGLPRRSGEGEDHGRLPVASLALLVLAATAFSVAAVVPVGPATAVSLTVGALLVIFFVVVERVVSSPVLPHIAYRRGNPLKWLYLVLAMLSAAAMVEMFLPKFGQEFAAMPPVVAGVFGATLSIGWSFVQLFSASVDRERTRRRFMLWGPIMSAVGLIAFAATQQADAELWRVLVWVGALFLTGAGIGLSFPHLSVAAMRASDDPVEGAKAAAGVGTVELIANAIASALVGVLVVVGGVGPAGAATMGAGLAVLAAFGVVAVVLALRSGHRL